MGAVVSIDTLIVAEVPVFPARSVCVDDKLMPPSGKAATFNPTDAKLLEHKATLLVVLVSTLLVAVIVTFRPFSEQELEIVKLLLLVLVTKLPAVGVVIAKLGAVVSKFQENVVALE